MKRNIFFSLLIMLSCYCGVNAQETTQDESALRSTLRALSSSTQLDEATHAAVVGSLESLEQGKVSTTPCSDTPEPPQPMSYIVTFRFVDQNGQAIRDDVEKEFEEGTQITYTYPEMEGYQFDSWDKTFQPATTQAVYTALYRKIETLRFVVDWSEVYAYVWFDNDNKRLEPYGTWNGTLLSLTEEGWYEIEVLNGYKVIFNNGAGIQTRDHKVTQSACYGLGDMVKGEGNNQKGQYILTELQDCSTDELPVKTAYVAFASPWQSITAYAYLDDATSADEVIVAFDRWPKGVELTPNQDGICQLEVPIGYNIVFNSGYAYQEDKDGEIVISEYGKRTEPYHIDGDACLVLSDEIDGSEIEHATEGETYYSIITCSEIDDPDDPEDPEQKNERYIFEGFSGINIITARVERDLVVRDGVATITATNVEVPAGIYSYRIRYKKDGQSTYYPSSGYKRVFVARRGIYNINCVFDIKTHETKIGLNLVK